MQDYGRAARLTFGGEIETLKAPLRSIVMSSLTTWLRRRRGAALTEKLFVLLFAVVLVGGAIMLFGPMLTAKYEFAASMLGGSADPTPTLADPRPDRDTGTNPLWYVLFVLAAAGFFVAFVTPMIFPRARSRRNLVLVELVDRFPFLTPLIDPDALADDNMEELRRLADEAKAREQHRENALEIVPADFARMADPSDATVDSDGELLRIPDEDLDLPDFALDVDPERTIAAEPLPLSRRMEAFTGDDEIPFDAVSPAVKPQMAERHKPRTDRMFSGGGPRTDRMFSGDEARPGTDRLHGVDTDTTRAKRGAARDEAIGDILRASAQVAAIATDTAETAIRTAGGAAPDEPTVLRDALPSPADTTAPHDTRSATDPDATTKQDWETL